MSGLVRLDALTSLRFFAAFAIVLHHSPPTFFPREIVQAWPLGQGVSFFFVLSGFILTHVYSDLPNGRAIREFWQARIARIWPGHIFATLLVVAVIGPSLMQGGDATHLLANVLLLHAWVPVKDYFFSLNALSWSISTEVGFYVLFPLLIASFSRTWHWKLAAALGLLFLLMAICQLLPLPQLDLSRSDVTSFGLLYISPAGRLFEFVLGMCTALVWQYTRSFVARAKWAWTGAELAAIIAVLYNMRYGTWALISVVRGSSLPVAEEWLVHSGSCIAFAALVFAMASGQGLIGRTLSLPLFVFLGEISFAMYLVHQALITLYVGKLGLYEMLPLWAVYPVFLITVVGASAAIFLFVERPARFWLRSWPRIQPTARTPIVRTAT